MYDGDDDEEYDIDEYNYYDDGDEYNSYDDGDEYDDDEYEDDGDEYDDDAC